MRDFIILIFGNLIKIFLGTWLKIAYNIKAYNDEIKDMNGPFLFVGNHCLNLDPFIAGLYIKPNVRYIASDSIFRNKILAFLLTNLVGAIPKKKAVSDLKTIKLSIKELKKGNVVGIYPEGNRTWDGKSLEIIYSTAKFVKLMKVPLVCCISKGAYLSGPRWSQKRRKGVLELHYSLLLTVEEVKSKSVEEIYEIINNYMKYNEFEWQKEKMIRFKSKRPAEFLENFLYICPKCNSISTMRSEKTEFKCTKCGLKYEMGEYGYFINKDREFETPMEWGNWQKEYFNKLIFTDGEIFQDFQAQLYKERKNGVTHKIDTGVLTLYKDRITFDSDLGSRIFMIDKITGNTIQLNSIFDFYYEGEFIRFHFAPKNRTSAYKWNFAVEQLRE